MYDFKVILFGALPSADTNANPGGIISATSGLLEYSLKLGVEVDVVDLYSDTFPPPGFFTKITRSLRRVYRLNKTLKTDNYDVGFLFCSSGFGFIERMLMVMQLKRAGVPSIVYLVSGHLFDEIKSSRLKRIVVKKLLGLPTTIAVQGRQTADALSQLGITNHRIKVLRNWLPPYASIAESPPKPARKMRFIYVGWLVPKKGIRELLDAVASSQTLRDASLTLMGAGDLLAEVRQKISQKNLINVKSLGWCAPEQVMRELEASDALILPTYAEGFPNVILEAMSKGLPVISTPTGAIAEAVVDGYTGTLVPARDADALRAAMEAFVLDDKKVKEMGYNCLHHVHEKYGFESNCRIALDAMRELVNDC